MKLLATEVRRRTAGLAAALVILWGTVSAAASAPPEAEAAPTDANDLSLQVMALRTLHEFGLSARQLRDLEALGNGASKNGKRKEAKISEKLRTALTDAREAFLKDDVTKIDEAEEVLDELLENEETELDDEAHLTDTARRRASEAVALMTPRQIVNFLGNRDSIPDPAELMADVAARGRKLKGAEWTDLRDETVDEVGRLAGGVDKALAGKIRDRAAIVLNKARGATGEPPTRTEFDRELRTWLGPDATWIVLRNVVHQEAAELLANPQLVAAIKGRLRTMGK